MCFFFGIKPQFYQVNGTNEVVFDWHTLLNDVQVPNGASIESLSAFCSNCSLPFVCEGDDIPANNRRLREFVQYCLPLCFAMVEGNHRMELCCRRFFGMHLLSKYCMERTSVPPLHGLLQCVHLCLCALLRYQRMTNCLQTCFLHLRVPAC